MAIKMKTNKKITYITASIAGITGIAVASGRIFFEFAVRSRRGKKPLKLSKLRFSQMKINHPRNQFEAEYEGGKAWCREQNMADWYIKSADGLRLHAYYLPSENKAKRYVLLSHGYKGSGFGDFANIAKFLHEHNCNLLFIDQRGCGESEGEFITFGVREQDDIRRWSYLIAKRNTDKLPIYLYGESMGTTSVLLASGRKLPDDVKGIIADCGFKSMKGQFRDMASKWFHLPRIELLLFRLSVWCRLSGEFSMKDSDTTSAMAVNRLPILFFHGSDDTYVYPKNTIDNYNICQAPKELVIVPDARHLCSAYVDPELYRRKIMNFFAKYD
jgi:alpha-beta hydrolase superfamily lysophospholipase